MSASNPNVLVTGASSGIGKAAALKLASRLKPQGVTVNAYHPGIVRGAGLMREAPSGMRIFSGVINLFGRAPQKAGEDLAELAMIRS